MQVVPPSDLSSLSETEAQQSQHVQRVIQEHRAAIEREIGSKIIFTESPDMTRQVWLIGPYNCNPEISKLGRPKPSAPEIFLDRQKGLMITDGQNPAEVTETYSYLRSLNQFQGGLWRIQNCETTDQAIDCIAKEIANSYPAFELRGLDWGKICEKHTPLVKAAENPIAAMQRWLAELQDAHTWVRPIPPFAELPYDVFVENNAGRFYRVPESSKAWNLGVRPGYELLDQDFEQWWSRTGAGTHSKPWIVGKRVMSSIVGSTRKLKARSPSGHIIEWEEEPQKDRWNPAISWRILDSGCGYIKIQAWMLGKGIEESIDEAFETFKGCARLIVDLRGSPGGNLMQAHDFRNRFLKKDGVLGWIQNTLPDGTLSEREPIVGKIPEETKRWTKPVVFLTDQLTYSASEDVLLGLQGQNDIQVVGQPSGGGSGRMRLLKLLPDALLTVSTSLTFDLNGHCIEGNGIPLDEIIPDAEIDLEKL